MLSYLMQDKHCNFLELYWKILMQHVANIYGNISKHTTILWEYLQKLMQF